ncbi:hypothetical protein KSC_095900 [Ktedonobacter sp. SOSP1-52]|uniref:CBM35 domain-containing protein n=1 Tax=Ktedonobacter sp. SOSP1-52 TaxID=2778366 RepID=UPI0019158839|nr:CBM35 domain-containing protein [Ktedonobacter sp. SOSP1-52]GHO70698.1 hypothetical protein KSC_095900 [Ktedonobacter sp. SOSP1-52]
MHKRRLLRGLVCSLILSATFLLLPMFSHPAHALNNGVALTPPMGWNSWNKFGCNISESLIKQQADAMVSSGLKAAGYQYINIDDCWQTSRDSNGNIVADATKFPSGIKALADYVHNDGLKLGIYTDAGTATCQGRPGSYNHEQQDANTYASWGIDYVKEDWCNTSGLDPQTQYVKMRDALANTGRAIVFSICDWGTNSPWSWGPATGNLWRTTGDISDSWSSMLSNLDSSSQHASSASPGAWNDPDMLEVGNGGMTTTEDTSHFSMWAIQAAPLIAGNDLSSMSTSTKNILTNSEVVAVDQDPAGNQGTKVSDNGSGLQVWSKTLQANGARAVALFNRSGSATNITVNWSDIGLSNASATVRDLWSHIDKGSFSGSYTANVPSHGVIMLKIVGSPVSSTSYEAESSANSLTGQAAASSCSSCSGGQKVGYVGNNSGTLQFNNVNVGSTGSYKLTIYYTNGDASRGASLSVNGGAADALSFTGTGSFNTVGTYTLAVSLNAGNNTIKFSNSSAWAPDFDRIVVGPGPASSFEAEASGNTLTGQAAASSCANCSGGQKVGYVGNNSGTLQFNNINVGSSGSYKLTIYYTDGDSGRSATISINGGSGTTLNFSGTGDWGNVGTYTVTINLNAGNNTIKFSNSSTWAPDFDRVTI